MAGPQREHQPVEEAPAARRRLGEQPVHGRRQPQHRKPFRQRIGRGRRAVDPDLPALGRVGERAGADLDARRAAPRPRSRPAPPRRAISARLAPRRPRPGESSDTASSTLVLPAPFSPVRMTKPGPGAISGVGVGAEIGQAEAGDRHAPLPRSKRRRLPSLPSCALGGTQMKDAEPNIAPIEVAGNRLTLLADGPRAARGADRADRRRRGDRCACSIISGAMTRPGTRVRDALVAAAERGVEVVAAGRRLRRVGATRDFFAAAGRRRRALLPLRAALGAALSAAQPPEAGAGRRPPGDHRRLQHLRRLFRDDRRRRLARPRPAGRGRRASPASSAISKRCSPGRESPTPRIRELRAAAPAEQRHRRHAPLAVRRPDPAAQPVGAGGAQRHDARRGGSTSSPPISRRARRCCAGCQGRPARRGRGSSRRRSSTTSATIGAARFTLLAAAEARRRDLRISADQAPYQALRDRRRRPYRLGQFRHAQPVPQPRDDAARRRSRPSPRRCAASSTARSPIQRAITPEAHRASMTWWNRLNGRSAISWCDPRDYNLSRRLNLHRKRSDASGGDESGA